MTVEMTHRPTFHVVPRSAKSALLLSDLSVTQGYKRAQIFEDLQTANRAGNRIGQDFVL